MDSDSTTDPGRITLHRDGRGYTVRWPWMTYMTRGRTRYARVWWRERRQEVRDA